MSGRALAKSPLQTGFVYFLLCTQSTHRLPNAGDNHFTKLAHEPSQWYQRGVLTPTLQMRHPRDWEALVHGRGHRASKSPPSRSGIRRTD